MSDKFQDLTIIVPTLNEERNINQLLKLISESSPGARVIVADDGSRDHTRQKVVEAASIYKEIEIEFFDRALESIHGITASVLDALSIVTTKYFAVIDGDLQHPPELLKTLHAKLHEGFNLVSGARLPYKENQGLHRIAFTRFATKLAKLVLLSRGHSVADPMSGFFAMETELAKQILADKNNYFELKGYKILFDLLRGMPKGQKVCNCYYQFGLRQEGKSKLRFEHAWYFIRSLLR